jgi:hypothetical protein
MLRLTSGPMPFEMNCKSRQMRHTLKLCMVLLSNVVCTKHASISDRFVCIVTGRDGHVLADELELFSV